ncbi:hypothetical protein NUM3379_26570 [Kineococcus sp. NUM-3379]
MPLVRDADAPAHTAHGFTFRSRATPSLGSSQVALWTVEAPPGARSPRHATSADEVFVVQRGEVVLVLDDGDLALAAGDTFAVPAGTAFALSNPGGEPAHLLACTTAGMHAVVDGRRLSPPWAA